MCHTKTDMNDFNANGTGFQVGPTDLEEPGFSREFAFYFTNEKKEQVACEIDEDPNVDASCTTGNVKEIPSHAPVSHNLITPNVKEYLLGIDLSASTAPPMKPATVKPSSTSVYRASANQAVDLAQTNTRLSNKAAATPKDAAVKASPTSPAPAPEPTNQASFGYYTL